LVQNKGVSPVIATVLLVAMVVVIGLIVFLWFKGMVTEEGTKFGKNVKLNCPEVNFKASYSGGSLSVVNTGTIPIYSMKIKLSEGGDYSTETVSDWPENGLNQGASFQGEIDIGTSNELLLIPVLIAKYGTGNKAYVCEEIYGKDVAI